MMQRNDKKYDRKEIKTHTKEMGCKRFERQNRIFTSDDVTIRRVLIRGSNSKTDIFQVQNVEQMLFKIYSILFTF